MTNATKRYIYFWLAFALGYVFPFSYFFVKLGITKDGTKVVIPVIFLGIVGILKLCAAIPKWTATWKPSFLKGVLKSIPIYLITLTLITLGLTLKTILDKQINVAFTNYFEFVFVFFGSLCAASIFDALHCKYRELDLLEKGYTLGVVNR